MENQKEQTQLSSHGHKANIKDLFRTPNLRMKTLIISFSWYKIDQ